MGELAYYYEGKRKKFIQTVFCLNHGQKIAGKNVLKANRPVKKNIPPILL